MASVNTGFGPFTTGQQVVVSIPRGDVVGTMLGWVDVNSFFTWQLTTAAGTEQFTHSAYNTKVRAVDGSGISQGQLAADGSLDAEQVFTKTSDGAVDSTEVATAAAFDAAH